MWAIGKHLVSSDRLLEVKHSNSIDLLPSMMSEHWCARQAQKRKRWPMRRGWKELWTFCCWDCDVLDYATAVHGDTLVHVIGAIAGIFWSWSIKIKIFSQFDSSSTELTRKFNFWFFRSRSKNTSVFLGHVLPAVWGIDVLLLWQWKCVQTYGTQWLYSIRSVHTVYTVCILSTLHTQHKLSTWLE